MEQFLRDHGTGTVPEHYYDQYVQDSIDRLRQALSAVDGRLRPRVPQDPGIALIGTLDTKGAEIAYVRDRLRALGARPLVVSTRGSSARPTAASPTSPRAEVARAGGPRAGRRSARPGSRGAAVQLMLEGVRAVVLRPYGEGRVHGVLCLGGAEGALLGAAAMHALPVGVPKLIVSPSASGRRAVRPVRRRGRRRRSCTR